MNRNSSLFWVAPNGKCITQRENVVKNTITVSTHCPGEPAQGRAGSWLGITFSFPCWSSSKEVWWDFKTFSPFSLSFAFFHSKVIPVFTYTISYRPCKHPSSVNISSSNPCTTAWLTYCKFLLPITKTKKGGEFLLILALTSVILSVNTLSATAAVSDRHVAVLQVANKLLHNPKEFLSYVQSTTASDSFLWHLYPSPALLFKNKKIPSVVHT